MQGQGVWLSPEEQDASTAQSGLFALLSDLVCGENEFGEDTLVAVKQWCRWKEVELSRDTLKISLCDEASGLNLFYVDLNKNNQVSNNSLCGMSSIKCSYHNNGYHIKCYYSPSFLYSCFKTDFIICIRLNRTTVF